MGVFCGNIINSDLYKIPYSEYLIQPLSSDFGIIFYLGYIIISAILMIIIIRYFNSKIIFILMEFFIISTASSIFFYSFFRLFFSIDISIILGIIFGIGLSGLKQKESKLKNLAAIIASIGVGVIFGITFDLNHAFIFLILLSIYDYLAVFATKHMQEMADQVIKNNLAFTISAETDKNIPKSQQYRMDLGTGDLIAPIMINVAAFKFSILIGIFVFIGSVVSLGVFLYLIRNKKIILPALPPLTIGMIIFYILGSFF